tara:strand:- start:42033 stop:42806 length:774 start_codon:yes stop_codon:yes gene_type:complete
MTGISITTSSQAKFKNLLSIILILCFTAIVCSQEEDKLKIKDHFSGSITATNNGISLVPTFSLGKPAAIFNLKMAKKDFSFEPEMRFGLNAKPWSFLFWFRYKAINNERFSLRVGAHPALNFRTINVMSNGVERGLIETRRYVASEIVPNYKITENTSVGMYYLFSKGLDDGLKTAHFVTVNSNFSNVMLTEDYFLNISPSVYYLKLDKNDGFYTTATVNFKKKDFPLSLQTIFNQRIKSNIISDNLVWNVSLVYSF